MNISDPQSVVGKNVVGADGEKIGKVEELYLDTQTQQPEWVSVSTGFFGSHVSLVPLAQASEVGGDLQVPYSKDQVKSAPHYDPGRELSRRGGGRPLPPLRDELRGAGDRAAARFPDRGPGR